MRSQKFGCKRNWSWLSFCLAKFGGLAFFALVAKLVNKWSYGFCAMLVSNCHKCLKNEVWKVWLQKELILVGFRLSQVRWIGFFALVAKLVNKWSYGFCAFLVGNCHKCIKNEVCKVWLQKELILVCFWLSQVRWISFFALVAKLVKKWSDGFCAILVGNIHKCIKNEVWKVWLQKELILVGFGLAKFGGLVFLPWLQNCWISEVMVFVQSWCGIFTNASKMRCEKFGCKRNWSCLGFGLAKFGGLVFFALVAKLVNKWSYGFCAILVWNCHKCVKN